jgi:hypothetical protein
VNRAAVVAGAVISMVVLTGCSAQSDARRLVSASDFASAGAWAPESADAVAEASPYEAEVLADGVITAAERSDAQARTGECMRDAGYRYREFDDGTAEMERVDGRPITSVNPSNDVLRGCERRFDRNISYLYNEIRRNPEKRDEAEIAVACLRASGLVDSDYTERSWRADNDTGDFPFGDYDAAAVQRRLDPLGLWRKG